MIVHGHSLNNSIITRLVVSVASNRLNQLNDATGQSTFHAPAKVSLTCMSTDLLSFTILVIQRALLVQN